MVGHFLFDRPQLFLYLRIVFDLIRHIEYGDLRIRIVDEFLCKLNQKHIVFGEYGDEYGVCSRKILINQNANRNPAPVYDISCPFVKRRILKQAFFAGQPADQIFQDL